MLQVFVVLMGFMGCWRFLKAAVCVERLLHKSLLCCVTPFRSVASSWVSGSWTWLQALPIGVLQACRAGVRARMQESVGS